MNRLRTSRNHTSTPPARKKQDDTHKPHAGAGIGRWLAASTTWFGPFTVITAAMSVLALAIGGPEITDTAGQVLGAADWTQPLTWAALLLKISASGLSFLPVGVAGYLAYGMAGRPALVPGVLGGMAAMGVQGGVLAGLAAGLIAGAATMALQRIAVPPALRDVTTTVLVPLLATVVTAAVLIVFAGPQLGALTTWLHQELAWLEFHNTVLVGVILGLMVCSDLGGAIGKTAIAFGTVGVSGSDPSKFNPTDMTMLAAVVAAGMVPALGLALATLVRGRVFNDAERAYGKVAWLFGATAIPEGAVPFAVADPLRVIPAGMAGGTVAGALVMIFGTTITVPYGGVFAIGQVGKPLLFALAVTAGVLVTAAATVALKSVRPTTATTASPARAGTRRKTPAAA
ncbi:PTS fructose transporter subunit IIC [Streptomyces sp. NPDC005492]|uniref:PTS fructose transporter subunit IIC n=1 Tax=Streptomyces sp. NPDC005492 TaxID=3156883 RepID=UPI0033B73E70